jgi:hypothetical protein
MFVKICDLCKQVTSNLHGGPKGTKTMEICDVCEHDLMIRITKLKQDEAATREALWARMILDWKTERSAPGGTTSM